MLFSSPKIFGFAPLPMLDEVSAKTLVGEKFYFCPCHSFSLHIPIYVSYPSLRASSLPVAQGSTPPLSSDPFLWYACKSYSWVIIGQINPTKVARFASSLFDQIRRTCIAPESRPIACSSGIVGFCGEDMGLLRLSSGCGNECTCGGY
jgi:hypothetical protein